jgi:prolyl-tRNA editing enzyme YbaK/EbsC (Cys-tRNA(Pro) deacylase)
LNEKWDMSSEQPYHPVTERIRMLLEREGRPYRTFEHEPVRTSEEAARTRPGFELRQGAKALVVSVRPPGDEKRFMMLVFPADRRFDSKKARASLGLKEIRFATPDEVAELTGGIEVGGVPPFGNLFDLQVAVDPSLYDNEWIVFNAGDRRFSLAMRSADYRELVPATECELV